MSKVILSEITGSLIFILYASTFSLLFHVSRKHRVRNYSDMERPLNNDDLVFIRRWTENKIDDESLKKHIMAIHNEVRSNTHVFRCVASFMYLNPRLYKHPNYFQVINLAKSKGSDYKLLDVGSCFGQEVRGLIADGVSPSSITITDLHDYYWKAGKRLYFDDESNKLDGVTTIFGDFATDPADIEKDISQDLTASFDCVICQAIFHVLSKKQSHFMIQRLFNVLKPGGILLGQCVGAPQAREWAFTPDGSAPRWLYSAESLTKELKSAGFTGEVKVTSETRWEFFMLTFYAVK